jgi:hypothetical protein
MSLSKPRETLVAESSASPNAPAQANYLVATVGTEVWSIDREERQVCEVPFGLIIAAKPNPRPRLKKSPGVGHTLRTDFTYAI